MPVFKNFDPSDKANYRLGSILQYQRYLKKSWMISFTSTQNIFSTSCNVDSVKAHSTQHALFKLLQKWQKKLDSRVFIGTILMDLSKAYDCLPHDLLIAKLETYGLENDSLNLLLDYLSFRKQRTKVGSVYSKLSKISRGILQGSILGPLLFNLFINDIAHDCRAIRFLQFCR